MSFLGNIANGFGRIYDGITGAGDESESAKQLRQGLQQLGDEGRAGYNALGAEAAQSRNYLRDQAMGKNSVSAEQLRQGLQQQQAQMQSMAQGGPASSAAMNARTAMLGAGRAASGMAGNAAMAGLQERNAAQQAWANSILGARGQDVQAALGAYGATKPEGSTLDKWGNAIIGGIGAAFCDAQLKTDVTEAGVQVDEMLDALRPLEFRYLDDKHGEGIRTGIMAQDLQKSPAGERLVIETADGLGIDLARTVPALLAVVARLNERIKVLEAAA